MRSVSVAKKRPNLVDRPIMSVREATIIGTARKASDAESVMLVFQKTPRGFSQRSTTRGYDRDYISNETFDDIREWMRLEFVSHKILHADFE